MSPECNARGQRGKVEIQWFSYWTCTERDRVFQCWVLRWTKTILEIETALNYTVHSS